ncbi:WD40-repeat-containing domain protein [Aspergillus crustosus]
MSTKKYARLANRPSASDATLENIMPFKPEHTKRRRSSTAERDPGEGPATRNALTVSKKTSHYNAITASAKAIFSSIDKATTIAPASSWSLFGGIAGQFINLDPCLTPDEQYLFLSLETVIHVYSTATSRLFRILEITPSDRIIGFRLCPFDQKRLYVFTLSGLVSEWDWYSSKQLAHWNTSHRTISAELVLENSVNDSEGAHNVFFALRERKDGKRDLAITHLDNERSESTIILDTSTMIESFRVIAGGQAIIACGGMRIFLGSSCSRDSKGPKYAWREVKLSTSITCVDTYQSKPFNQNQRRIAEINELPEIGLALGGADGSIMVYHDAFGFLGSKRGRDEDRKLASRRLHWHRDPVKAIRWSRDGNYVISGGHESVMVLWQLDTGRKEFLPHLSSPICNIVVSATGNSYAVKLADNRVVVLSARELQPLATITGLQLCARHIKAANQPTIKSLHPSRAVAATLHPRYPDQLLITVPACHQLNRERATSTSAPILQIYDIRSNTHISRQALARTNVTTLNIGPDGTQILTPDIIHLGVSEDGRWMATVDSWSPYPEDTEVLKPGTDVRLEHVEIYLKFWRWNESTSLWELVTRIDSPHLSAKCSAPILNLASRPNSHEFVTIGSDALLRFWRPVIRQRQGLKKAAEQVPETWRCRSSVDLRGYLESCNAKSTHLHSASTCFSEDGSVLAACIQSTSKNPGLTILIDVRSCSVKYSKIGLFSGDIISTAFLGRHLLIATRLSVFIWDTVNDTVRMASSEVQAFSEYSTHLLAVNARTQTFATASRHSQKKTNSKKHRKSGFTVQVYDIDSLSILVRFKLAKEPVALLSSLQSADYVVLDASANVQQIGCSSKASQVSHAYDRTEYSDFGLEGLFRRHITGTAKSSLPQSIEAGGRAQPSERDRLSRVFGDTPPFVLPPSRVIFSDLVKAFSA